jgi:circadian clock protein KaiB
MDTPPVESRTRSGRTAAPETYVLRLYVAGEGPNSMAARRNLDALCERCLAPSYRIETVDLLETPARGIADGVLVTPTLLKLAPEPRAMVVGSLSDEDRVLRELGLPRSSP